MSRPIVNFQACLISSSALMIRHIIKPKEGPPRTKPFNSAILNSISACAWEDSKTKDWLHSFPQTDNLSWWATDWMSGSNLYFRLMSSSKNLQKPKLGSWSKSNQITNRKVLPTMSMFLYQSQMMLKILISEQPQEMLPMFLKTMLWNGQLNSSLATSNFYIILR